MYLKHTGPSKHIQRSALEDFINFFEQNPNLVTGRLNVVSATTKNNTKYSGLS